MNFSGVPPEAQDPPSEAEVIASVGLGLLPGVGPRTTAPWLERVGAAEPIWRTLPAWLGARRDREDVLAAWRSLDPGTIIAKARAHGIAILAWRDPAYPPRLRTIPDPPPALFACGELVDAPAVAIVGSRRATAYGRAAAGRLAYDLAQAGVTIVSGLARGIDGTAHRAALDAGGETIAVLGCGVDIVYPREHRQLAQAIVRSGALVSEFAPGVPPLPHHFPRRNRLISGLAMGVVVVEGAADSGALLTVDYALDQGRDVFAVPGSIFSQKSRAPHRLLRQGAHVVEDAGDVLDALRLTSTRTGRVVTSAFDAREPESTVLSALDSGPCAFDDVVDASGLPAAHVAALVTVLELRGLIQTLPGQMLMRTPRGAG